MALMTARIAQRRGDAPALSDEDGSIGWSALDRRVNRLVRALRASGLAPGERVALFAGNGRAVFELMLAASHAGVRFVPVNWHFTVDELAHVLADSGARGLFTDTLHAPAAAAALERVPEAGARFAVCAAVSGGVERPAGFIDFDAWVDGQCDDSEPPAQAAGGPMFYTSGTTGRPKGVIHVVDAPPPLDAVMQRSEALVQGMGLPADGTTLLCGPYYHSAQYAFGFMPMLAGCSVVMSRRFDAARTLALIDQHRVTNVHLVPTQFVRLLRLPEADRRAFSGASLVRVWHGAAPCPPQVKREMIEWWGPCIHEYYGSTEGSVVTGISSQEWLERPDSVGRAVFTTDVVILRDDGSPADVGEQGTIYLRNRRGADLAYHNDPEKTRAAHQSPGLFTTGDVGWLDADGYLRLTDRKIDMIISGGVNIYPAEIEGALAAHPAVHDVAVIGVPNAEFGEEVRAIVQPAPGHAPGEALAHALQQHCRTLLAGYKAYIPHIGGRI